MSRVMGPAWGGSVGIIFAIANAINASLNVVGFCQTIQAMMKQYGDKIIIDGGDNDIRITGTLTMFAVLGLCGLGAKYEAKVIQTNSMFYSNLMKYLVDKQTQVVLMAILMIAILNFLVGSIIGPKNNAEEAKGFIGYHRESFE